MTNSDHFSPDTNRSQARSSSKQASIERISRSRSRSPLSTPRNGSHSYRKQYNERPRTSLNDPARLNPERNEVLAVFGLDRDASNEGLFEVFRKFRCEKCKIIYDKIVI